MSDGVMTICCRCGVVTDPPRCEARGQDIETEPVQTICDECLRDLTPAYRRLPIAEMLALIAKWSAPERASANRLMSRLADLSVEQRKFLMRALLDRDGPDDTV